MQFAATEHLWLLILFPLGMALGYLRQRVYQSRLSKLVDHNLLPDLLAPENLKRDAQRHYRIFLCLVLTCLMFAALRPQWGFVWRESKHRGGNIVVAVDVSDSMLAADISPTRLERAKRKISDLLNLLRGDRISLVAFAGVSFIETPLTLDYAAFRQFLPLLQPDLIPVKGSNLESALRKSLEALQTKDGNVASANGSAIILITDGEELDGDFETVGKIAEENNVRIYVLGIGSQEGAPIPTPEGYKKDRSGKVIITRLRPELLEKLALLTKGTYVQSVSSSKDVEAIYNDNLRSALSQSEKILGNAKRWNEYYQVPLALGILLLLLFLWGSGYRKAPVLVLSYYFLTTAPLAKAAEPEALGSEARESFEQGQFATAEQEFQQGSKLFGSDRRMWLGLGASQYRQGKYTDAQASFAEALRTSVDPLQKSEALYNLGNSFAKEEHYREAIDSYSQALSLSPEDREITENLALAKKLLEQQKQQEKKDNDNKEKQQQNDQGKENEEKQSDSQQKEQSQQKDSSSSENHSNSSQAESNESSASSGDEESSATAVGDSSSDAAKEQAAESSADSEQTEDSQEQSSVDENGSSSSSQDENKGGSAESSSSAASELRASGGSGDTGSSEPSPRQDELDTLLKSVEEKYDANMKYRAMKAMQQLKAEKRKIPERDW